MNALLPKLRFVTVVVCLSLWAASPARALAGGRAPDAAPAAQSPQAAQPQPARQATPVDQAALLAEIARLREELEALRKTYDERLAALEAQVAAAAAGTPPAA